MSEPNCAHGAIRAMHPTGACVLCDGAVTTPTTAPHRRARPSVAAIERALCRRSFLAFVERYWPVVTGMPLVRNRAVDEMASALQRVADGDVTRLLIAIAPGTGKSTMLCLYSAWRLARDPSWRSIHASHAFDLASTESRRVRRLIDSAEFRALFSGVEMRENEAQVGHWATTKDGRYFAVGRDTALTGRRAHEAVCDDPLNALDRFSKAERDATWAWFTESLSTRLDGDRAPMIVVQQRLDRDDLIGRLIEAGGWTLVELPAEFEDGTLLAPNVLSRAKLDTLKRQIGASTYATQYLQRAASDDDGAVIKRAWWKFHRPPHVAEVTPRPSGCNTDEPAVPTPTRFDRIVIAVDMTFGGVKSSNDYAVIQCWGSVGTARYLIEQWRARATQAEQRAVIKSFAKRYPRARIVIEKAAGGAGAIEEMQADGLHNVHAVTTGNRGKLERLGLVSPTIENGFALLPLGAPWLGDYVEELAGATRHDDAQDATAYALHELNTAGADERAALINAKILGTWDLVDMAKIEREVDAILAFAD